MFIPYIVYLEDSGDTILYSDPCMGFGPGFCLRNIRPDVFSSQSIPPETLPRFGNPNQKKMVRHQAGGPHLNGAPRTPHGHHLQVGPIVVL